MCGIGDAWQKRRTLGRREFVASAGAFLIGGCASCARSDAEYSVPLLGDVHFDETEWGLYHVGWKPRDERDAAGRKREFVRNAEMWRERMPSLIAAAAACRTDKDAFMVQLGDLVQGDVGDMRTMMRFYSDAIKACRRGFGSLPFLSVAGNHDVRNGGRAAYDAFFPAFHSGELGERIDATDFVVRRGPDAWIFADFMRPDAERLFSAIENAADARYMFVVCHSPLTPVDNWGYYWFLFGKPEDSELRRRFRSLLMRHNVIALCGHTHMVELDEWISSEGRLTQLVLNSVWTTQTLAVPRKVADDPKTWGDLYVKRNASDVPEEHDGHYTSRTRNESLSLMAEYADGLVRYEKYDAAGHGRLHVSDSAVFVDFYGGDAVRPCKRFILRQGRS